MNMLTVAARRIGETDREAVERLLDEEPYAAAQVAERITGAGIGWGRTDARIFGYGPRGQLDSLCWLGANLIPVRANGSAIAAFADLARRSPRTCSSLVGDAEAVLELWRRLEHTWGPAREVRACQPLLATRAPSSVTPDPGVRLVRPDEIDVLFPASVAMYTEEVGISPLIGGGERDYRERVTELVRGRRSYAKIVDEKVVFKAELAVVTRHTTQVQGVWVALELRGRGIATAGMAA